jgi:hypothetical protein
MRKTWDQFNGPERLKCNCLATLARRTFPAIWMKIEKYVFSFYANFKIIIHLIKKITPYSSDLDQTVCQV